MEDISKLTSSELRKRLQEAGLPSGPITTTTRKIFESKLKNYFKKLRDPQNEMGEKNVEVDACVTVDSNLELNAPTKAETPKTGVFFGICIPASESDDVDCQVPVHVYQDRNEAMKILRLNQGARFKTFKTEEEARKFARSRAEANSVPVLVNQIVAEKSSSYKSLKTIELVGLMKIIEQNDVTNFKQLVWSNPRYLISSGDTPVILKSGPRYNALHIAAKHNAPAVCVEVLSILQNDTFLGLVFANDSPTVREERSRFLLDLYLNTPDKGQCDTPLHFASKFGHIDVLEILMQHPQCDKGIHNKYGQTPRDVICDRCDESRLENLKRISSRNIESIEQLRSKIETLLDDNFYVAVYRSEGNSSPAMIAEPWSPDLGDKVTIYNQRHASPISPNLQVKAFAGPMSPQKAHHFHLSWTSPRKSSKKVQQIRRTDDEKGLERVGRSIAQDMAVPWSEYWEFLGQFADFSTSEGLNLLEDYLQSQLSYHGCENDNLIKNFSSLSLTDKIEEGRERQVKDNLINDFSSLSLNDDIDPKDEKKQNINLIRRENQTSLNYVPSSIEKPNSLRYMPSSIRKQATNIQSDSLSTVSSPNKPSGSVSSLSSSSLQPGSAARAQSLILPDNRNIKECESIAEDFGESHGEMLQSHGEMLQSHGEMLQSHGEMLQSQMLQSHGEMLQSHGEMLQPQGEMLQPHGEMLQSNGEMLQSHGEMLLHGNIILPLNISMRSQVKFLEKSQNHDKMRKRIEMKNYSNNERHSSIDCTDNCSKTPQEDRLTGGSTDAKTNSGTISHAETFITESEESDNHIQSSTPKTTQEINLTDASFLSTPKSSHQVHLKNSSNISISKTTNDLNLTDSSVLSTPKCSHHLHSKDSSVFTTPKFSYRCSARFIQGFEPSKLDMNVYFALQHIDIPRTYQHVIAYKELVESYSLAERERWKTPRRHNSQQRNMDNLIGIGKSDVKFSNTSYSLSPILQKSVHFFNGAIHQDIRGKLFN